MQLGRFRFNVVAAVRFIRLKSMSRRVAYCSGGIVQQWVLFSVDVVSVCVYVSDCIDLNMVGPVYLLSSFKFLQFTPNCQTWANARVLAVACVHVGFGKDLKRVIDGMTGC